MFNLPKHTKDFEEEHKKYRPKPIQDNIVAIEKFGKVRRAFSLPFSTFLPDVSFILISQDVHNKVIIPLLVVLAVVLELEDEEYFVKRHVYEKRSEDREFFLLHPHESLLR